MSGMTIVLALLAGAATFLLFAIGFEWSALLAFLPAYLLAGIFLAQIGEQALRSAPVEAGTSELVWPMILTRFGFLVFLSQVQGLMVVAFLTYLCCAVFSVGEELRRFVVFIVALVVLIGDNVINGKRDALRFCAKQGGEEKKMRESGRPGADSTGDVGVATSRQEWIHSSEWMPGFGATGLEAAGFAEVHTLDDDYSSHFPSVQEDDASSFDAFVDSGISYPSINPANGLLMLDGGFGIDIAGNPYGLSDHDFSSSSVSSDPFGDLSSSIPGSLDCGVTDFDSSSTMGSSLTDWGEGGF